MTTYDIVQDSNNKFLVTKNGDPIRLPKTDGSHIVTEFDNKVDAEKYLSILKHLTSRKTKV
jgi:hypothetical protein